MCERMCTITIGQSALVRGRAGGALAFQNLRVRKKGQMHITHIFLHRNGAKSVTILHFGTFALTFLHVIA